MSTSVRIPDTGGSLRVHTLTDPVEWPRPAAPLRSRIAYAAAHVIPPPLAANVPGEPARVDWDATLAFRRHLWSYGLGVAEAMDTAQRGMGLDWPAAAELISRSAAEARSVGGRICAGAGTDSEPEPLPTLDAVAAAYCEQVAHIEDTGATVVLMASRDLARLARDPDDYLDVYGRVLRQVRRPVVLHWLGPDFDPALDGYWGSGAPDRAAETVVALVTDHPGVVDGVKVSVLDAALEVRLRRALPAGVRVYTGDDFSYPDLVRGDEQGASDALLGAFAAVAPAASTALQALDRDDLGGYDAAMAAGLPLSRHVFAAPTRFYKTGIAFVAWLSGHQDGFSMVAGLQSGRGVGHLVEVFRLADRAGLLPDPELAARRMSAFLSVAGVAA